MEGAMRNVTMSMGLWFGFGSMTLSCTVTPASAADSLDGEWLFAQAGDRAFGLEINKQKASLYDPRVPTQIIQTMAVGAPKGDVYPLDPLGHEGTRLVRVSDDHLLMWSMGGAMWLGARALPAKVMEGIWVRDGDEKIVVTEDGLDAEGWGYMPRVAGDSTLELVMMHPERRSGTKVLQLQELDGGEWLAWAPTERYRFKVWKRESATGASRPLSDGGWLVRDPNLGGKWRTVQVEGGNVTEDLHFWGPQPSRVHPDDPKPPPCSYVGGESALLMRCPQRGVGIARRPIPLPDGLRGKWVVTGGDDTSLAYIFRRQLEINDLSDVRFEPIEGALEGAKALRQDVDGTTYTWGVVQGEEATVRAAGTLMVHNERSHFLGALVQSAVADVDLWLDNGDVFHLKAMPNDSWLGWAPGEGENGHLFILHRDGQAPSWAQP
jgi:hypothetical protein